MSSENSLPPSAYQEDELKRHYHNFDVEKGRYKFIIDSLQPNSKILEVGCFLGRYSDHFEKLGHCASGVDISEKVIKEGKKLFPKLDLRCSFEKKLQDIFEPGSFDAVVASEVIEHVLHPQDFLNEIRTILKPEGQLLLTTQNSNAIHYRLRMLVGKFRWDPTHLRLYSKPELKDEIESSGFLIQKMKGIPINPDGPQQLVRKFAYYSTFLNPNFCWTWGVIAKPANQGKKH